MIFNSPIIINSIVLFYCVVNCKSVLTTHKKRREVMYNRITNPVEQLLDNRVFFFNTDSILITIGLNMPCCISYSTVNTCNPKWSESANPCSSL